MRNLKKHIGDAEAHLAEIADDEAAHVAKGRPMTTLQAIAARRRRTLAEDRLNHLQNR